MLNILIHVRFLGCICSPLLSAMRLAVRRSSRGASHLGGCCVTDLRAVARSVAGRGGRSRPQEQARESRCLEEALSGAGGLTNDAPLDVTVSAAAVQSTCGCGAPGRTSVGMFRPASDRDHSGSQLPRRRNSDPLQRRAGFGEGQRSHARWSLRSDALQGIRSTNAVMSRPKRQTNLKNPDLKRFHASLEVGIEKEAPRRYY
jgi:hypothetical protein